jgi:hypothetical protein
MSLPRPGLARSALDTSSCEQTLYADCTDFRAGADSLVEEIRARAQQMTDERMIAARRATVPGVVVGIRCETGSRPLAVYNQPR